MREPEPEFDTQAPLVECGICRGFVRATKSGFQAHRLLLRHLPEPAQRRNQEGERDGVVQATGLRRK